MPPPPSSDADLVAHSRTDPEAFGGLFDRHADAVHAFLSRRADRQVADDLLGEVFAVAFERRRRYDGTYADARPWLYGIAHQLLRNHFRSGRRRRALLLRTPAEAPDQPWDDVVARIDADVAASSVARALAALPEAERVVVQLMAWEDLGPAEVARVLGVPPGTVRSRLHRARTALRAALPSLVPQED